MGLVPQPLCLPRLHQGSGALTNVAIQPLPLAAILDHHLRRPEQQDRVIGTLLGIRNSETGEVEVRSSFGVPYAINDRDVAVDSDHHRALLDLHHRVSPKEVVVGWYATSPVLNCSSSLIQDFYNSECMPAPAFHLTLDPATLNFKTYLPSPIGLSTLQTLNILFKPVPSSLSVPTPERAALELLSKPITSSSSSEAAQLEVDLKQQQLELISKLREPLKANLPMHHLHHLLTQLKQMIDQVYEYVGRVNSGEIKGNNQLGKFLLDTIGSLPIGLAGSHNAGKAASFEDDFQAHIADVLMVSYVATLVRDQVEISSRLNLLVSQ